MTTERDHDHGPGRSGGAPHGIHRFLLTGKKKIFSYHLALYNVEAHAFQAVMTLGLQDDVRAAYLDDLRLNEGNRVFYSLFSPEHFPLTDLQRGKTFNVQLERVVVRPDGSRDFQKMLGGRQTDAVCRPEDVLHFRKLGGLGYPDHLTCLLFGEGDEAHLAHQLAKQPNWDEVLTVTTPQPVDPATLKKVPAVTVDSVKDAHGVLTQSPLRRGETYEATVPGTATRIPFTAGRQSWWNHTSLNA